MKVTVDTRHDSLEEALATVRAAFGSRSSRTQPALAAVAAVPTRQPARTKKVAKSPSKPSALKKAPASKSPGRKAPAKKGVARRGTNVPNSGPTIAPAGRADTIRA